VKFGRKFEAERAIFHYNLGHLVEVNATLGSFDLRVSNMSTIQFIEVKWSQGAVSRSTLSEIIVKARMHPSYTYLLETTWILQADKKYLFKEGGREY
jgi:hypothetical protein